MSSDFARALIKRYNPQVLANRAQELVSREVAKGCEPTIATVPVELEPAYTSLRDDAPPVGPQPQVPWIQAVAEDPDVWHRMQVWISPEEKCSWRNSERFLKQVSGATRRVAIELVGNRDRIDQLLLFHRHDGPVVDSAFHGEFKRCELTSARAALHARMRERAPGTLRLRDFYPSPPYSHMFTTPEELGDSIYGTIVTALGRLPSDTFGLFQVLFQPVPPEHDWYHNIKKLIDLEYEVKQVVAWNGVQIQPHHPPSGYISYMAKQSERRAHPDKPLFFTALRVATWGSRKTNDRQIRALAAFRGMIQHGGRPIRDVDEAEYCRVLTESQLAEMLTMGRTYRPGFLVNSEELSTLAHFTSPTTTEYRPQPIEQLEPLAPSSDLAFGVQIGVCDHAGKRIRVCLPPDVRSKHMHVIGRPGTGKSTMLEHMILQEIRSGHGVAVLDPHGALIDRLLRLIPDDSVDRVIYVNPADRDYVPIWNPLHCEAAHDAGRVTANLVAAVRSIVDGSGDRLTHLLRHAFFALLHSPGSSLRDVNDLLRKGSPASKRIIKEIGRGKITNDLSRRFWSEDFRHYRPDDIRPPQHKLSKLLLGGTVSLMLSQPDSAFSLSSVMDQGNVLLMDLSDLGADTRDTLGCFMLALLYETALGRHRSTPAGLRPFHIYCDEAHRFMTEAVDDLIAETRKYSVSLTLAHQFMSQFDRRKIGALSSVASTVIFNVDRHDATYLKKDLLGRAEEEDLITQGVGQAIARISTRRRTEVVRIKALRPLDLPEKSQRQAIIARSRQRYCKPVSEVQRIIDGRTRHWRQRSDATEAPSILPREPEHDEF
ncbi:MAG: type IV secretion system DNA-binding domain-containing protein [Phycisphaerae bacterium]|nr:type IV secretion system DNA-binding domain-containing protein [Phycisphaerae bacterium]